MQEAYAEATKSGAASPAMSDSTLGPRKKPESGLRYSYAEPPKRAPARTPTPRSPLSPGSASGSEKDRVRKGKSVKSPKSPLERAAELADFKAMGRSMLGEDELALDELRLGGR